MFSDKFIEINNYSLIQKKYLDTSSIMPWRYTPVFDNAYEPEISETVKNKLQLFFYYRLQYTPLILEDDKKYLEITHNNSIKRYRAINPIKLPLFLDPGEWNHFIHSLEITDLLECKQKIFDYVSDGILASGITSVTYDDECNVTGIYFQHDPNIMLNHSEMANKLCATTNSIGGIIPTVHINPIDNEIRYNLSLKYSSMSFRFLNDDGKTTYNSSGWVPARIKNQPQTEKLIRLLKDSELLTEDMIDYVNEVVPKETKIELEYVIDESGTLTDVILKNIVIEEFSDLANKSDHPMYDIFEKRMTVQ